MLPLEDHDARLWATQVLVEIAIQMKDDRCELYNDLKPCGKHLVAKLALAAQITNNSTDIPEHKRSLSEIVDAAHQQMRVNQHQAVHLLCWRRLYTDASLIWSLLDIISCQDTSEDLWRMVLSRLDHAIIVAGAPGEGRLDLVLDAIQHVQSVHLPLQGTYTSIHNLQPSRHSDRTLVRLMNSRLEVPCLSTPPSLATFQSKYSNAPFILRGFALDWPAITNHPWSCKSYLHEVSGRGRVVPVEVGRDYRLDDWTNKMMDWDAFLDYLFPEERPDPPDDFKEVIYLAQHNLLKQFPNLRSDIIIPDYVYTSLTPPANFKQYQPPENDEGMVINAWLGPENTVSPAHTDPYFNFYVQVVGRKTIWLAPPWLSTAMTPYPATTSSSSHNHLSQEKLHNPAANQITPELSNTSCIDVFADYSSESATVHEDQVFMEEVIPHAMSAILNPGDMLFFPPGWWHAMRSEDTSFSLSMWF